MAREKLCVGIDIGASAVKLCQLQKTKKGIQLKHFGYVPLPADTVVEGSLMNSARVVDAITQLISTYNIKTKRVAISVSGHSVIIKKIPMPQMTRQELEASIQWEAGQFIPFDIRDVYLDVEIVKPVSAQQGQMDVVLVAAKKELIDEYTTVVMEAGLEPVICDVDAFAVENMFSANYDMAPNETLCLVNIGAAKTNINIIASGISGFTRDISVGGNTITAEIQRTMNVPYDKAEQLKHAHDSATGGDANVQRAIAIVAEQVASEVQRSIDFYSATSADPVPTKIYLSGGSSRLEVLQNAIASRVQIPVERINPFRRIEISADQQADIDAIAPAAAVAVGLALRFPGDM